MELSATMRCLHAFAAIVFPLFFAPSVAPTAYKYSPIAEVTLRVVDPVRPALLFTNATDSEAKEIAYWVRLWNLDRLEGPSPLPIQDGALGQRLRPHETSTVRLFEEPETRRMLRKGDRIVGSLSVVCGTCARGYSYRVYIAYGEGGWFSEVENLANGAALTLSRSRDDKLKETLLSWANAAAEEMRIPIAPFAP